MPGRHLIKSTNISNRTSQISRNNLHNKEYMSRLKIQLPIKGHDSCKIYKYNFTEKHK